MKNVRVARRYAIALMSAAEEKKAVDRVATDVETVGRMVSGSREFALFLASPVIQATKKMAVLKELLGSVVGTEVLTFCLLLARKGREEFLADVIDQFGKLLDERRGIVDVDVRTAVPMSDDQSVRLRERLERHTSRKVRLNASVEKELRGGLLIRIGDTVLDGSVRHQLEVLKGRFATGGTVS